VKLDTWLKARRQLTVEGERALFVPPRIGISLTRCA
jgi:hypothetical protein